MKYAKEIRKWLLSALAVGLLSTAVACQTHEKTPQDTTPPAPQETVTDGGHATEDVSAPDTEPDTLPAEEQTESNSRDLLTFTPASPAGQVLTDKGNSPPILIENYNEMAIDALGRALPTSEEAGLPRSDKYVGIFYSIWTCTGGSVTTTYDVSKILAANPDHPSYSKYAFHWWAEPETGYHRADDVWQIKRDMYYFAMAGVDFIYLDFTNSYMYENGFRVLLDTCLEMRAAGQMTPYVVPWGVGTNNSTDNGDDLGDIYRTFYTEEKYDDLWFRWEGKPLVMVVPDSNGDCPIIHDELLGDYFTYRYAWLGDWPGERKGYKKWCDNDIVNYGYSYGWDEDRRKAECVAIGCAGFANYGAGRSGALSARPYVDRFKETTTMGQGIAFQEAFEAVMKHNPEAEVLLLSRWNEWTAQYYEVHDFGFVDEFNAEFSRDMEPMKGGFTDNYFYQMCAMIRRFKGVLPADGHTGARTIAQDEATAFDQWQHVAPVFRDFVGDTSVRDSYDPKGLIHYVNDTGRNDIVESRMTADADNLYVYVQTADAITPPLTSPNWMLLFLDVDNDKSTGWEGYDYLINQHVPNATQTTISRYVDEVWQEIGTVSYLLRENQLMVTIPRSALGLTADAFTVNFHWMDHVTDLYSLESWFTTGDSAPERRNNYTLSMTVPFSGKTVELPRGNRLQTAMPAVSLDDTEKEALQAGLQATPYHLPAQYGKQPNFGLIDSLTEESFAVEGISATYTKTENYALLFEGYLKVDETKEYTFTLTADDSAVLYVDGREIANTGYDPANTEPTHTAVGSLRLSEGYHTFRLEYAECGNGTAPVLKLDMEGEWFHIQQTTVKKENIALNKQLTASKQEGVLAPALALDGSLDTRWGGTDGNDPSERVLVLDLGQVYVLDSSTIYWESNTSRKYTLYLSEDGEHFTEFGQGGIDVLNNDFGAGISHLDLESRQARYIKMVIDANTQFVSIWEWQVFGQPVT